MTKKFKLLSLTGITLVVGVPALIVACGKTTPDADVKTSAKLLNEANQKIAIGNIKGTVNQVVTVFGRLLTEAKATESQISDETKKNSLIAYLSSLTEVQTKLNANGVIRAKINSLDQNASDYKTKLDELVTDFKALSTDILTAYKTYAKILNPATTDAQITTALAGYEAVKEVWSAKAPEVSSLTNLDLARLVESSNQLPKADNSSPEQDQDKQAKYLAQTFNLLVKRELQTVAMARIVEESDVSDAKIVQSLAKQNDKLNSRLGSGKVPGPLLTKVNSLEAQFQATKDELEKVKTAQAAEGVSLTDEDKKHLSDAENKLANVQKNYSGLEATAQPAFAVPGIKKLAATLNTDLNALPTGDINSVLKFNIFFQKASPTWASAAGLYINAKNAYANLKELEQHLNDYKAAVIAKKSSATTQTTPYDNLKTATEALITKVTSLLTDFQDLVTLQNASGKELSTWVVNQNARALSSLAQLYLLQIAVDNLDNINQADVAL